MSGSRIDDLLEGVTLEDILDREGAEYRVQRGSSGEQLNIQTCPFCGGDEWKVYANRDSGLGNCFHGSCQERFNTFKFAKGLLRVEDAGSVRKYLEQVAKEIGWRPRRRKIIDVDTNEVVEWEMPPSLPLPTKDGANLVYLEQRGIDGATAEFFKLRYCVNGWFSYIKPDGSKGGTNFSQRVLIPIYDLSGDLVTFQGRDITGTAERKYLFPTGLPGTAAFLYNGHRVVGKRRLVVCEGSFDVIRTWQHLQAGEYTDLGIVGSFGIQFSKSNDGADQLHQLIRLKHFGLEEVTMMWDAEPVAFQKALKACETISKIGLKTRIAMLPAGKDPGDATAFEIQEALRRSVEFNRLTALKLSLSNPYSVSQK